MSTPVFYDPRQNIDKLASFSPSAGKPARFVELIRHFDFRAYGNGLGPVTPVTLDDLYRVHDKSYVDAIFSGTVLNGFENRDPRVPQSCLWTAGSLLVAARHALKDPRQPVCSPTSGFHHAGHAWGGGYCTFNGLMVVAAKLLDEHPGMKIGILDCEMHYGDGTQNILDRFPELSRRIIHCTQGKHFHGDDPQGEALEFFVWLANSIADLNAFGCDLVLYQAGADPHILDPLGGFLSSQDLALRDALVFHHTQAAIAWNLAGGYQKGKTGSIFDDPVLEIHHATLRASDASYGVRRQ